MRRFEIYLLTLLLGYWFFAGQVIFGTWVADQQVLFGVFLVLAWLPLFSPYIARQLNVRHLAWDVLCRMAKRPRKGR